MEPISVVIPIYNEEKSVKATILNIKSVLNGKLEYEIIAVNDASTDSTLVVLKNLEGIKIIDSKINKGYGASIKKGIRNAKYEQILIIDADGTYPVDRIPDFLKYYGEYDMVIGSRTGKTVHIPFLRRPAKVILKLLAYIASGFWISDLNSGLRIFRKDLALKFFRLLPERFSLTTTITLAALCNGYDVKFIPVDYLKREGKSSIHPVRDFFGFSSLIFRIIMYFKPLRFFFLPSLLILIAGIMLASYQIVNFSNVSDSAVILIFSGINIGFLGLLADIIVKNR